MNEQYKRIALALGFGVAAGCSLVGIFTLILSSAEFRSPERFSNAHPNATLEEILSKWSKYNNAEFEGTITIGALGIVMMTVLFAIIFRACQPHLGTQGENLEERGQVQSFGQSLRNPSNYLFGSSASLTSGFAFSGAVSLLKAIFLHDYPKTYFKKYSPTEAELLLRWAAYIKDDFMYTLVIALTTFLVLPPAFAVIKPHLSFLWNPSRNSGEDRHLLASGNSMPSADTLTVTEPSMQ